MTLDQWLQEATGIFPAGVQKRLAQEYRAHLEDSVAAGGSGDPVELFGMPSMVRRSLVRTYIPAREFDEMAESGSWPGVLFAIILLSSAVFGVMARPSVLPIVCVAVAMSGWAGLGRLTREWPRLRRAQMKRMSDPALVLVLQLSNLSAADWLGRGAGLVAALGLTVIVAIVVNTDARIRRTLELKGVKA